MKVNSDGSAQCYPCQVRDIENAMKKNLPPNHPKVREIIARRQLALEEKLRQDELKHQRSQNRMKIVVKSPKRLLKQKQQQQQQQSQLKNQNQRQQRPPHEYKIGWC